MGDCGWCGVGHTARFCIFDGEGGAHAKQAYLAGAAFFACAASSSVKFTKSGWILNTTPSPITHVACSSNLRLGPTNLLALLLSVTQPQLTQPSKVCN